MWAIRRRSGGWPTNTGAGTRLNRERAALAGPLSRSRFAPTGAVSRCFASAREIAWKEEEQPWPLDLVAPLSRVRNAFGRHVTANERRYGNVSNVGPSSDKRGADPVSTRIRLRCSSASRVFCLRMKLAPGRRSPRNGGPATLWFTA